MPIRVEPIEFGLYLNVCEGVVNLREVIQARTEMAGLADASKCARYVVVTDTTQVKNIRADFHSLRRAADFDSRTVAVIVVYKGLLVRTMVDIIKRISSVRLGLAEARDIGFARARSLLAEREPQR